MENPYVVCKALTAHMALPAYTNNEIQNANSHEQEDMKGKSGYVWGNNVCTELVIALYSV